MLETPEIQDASAETYKNAAHKFYFVIPVYLVVPVGFWLAFQLTGVRMNWTAFGIGAAGWLLALMLRGPIVPFVKNLPKERATNLVGSASGPLEEGVRVLVLVLTGMSFRWAAFLGQGWAAVEVLFVVINGIVLMSMIQRTDDKAMEVKKFLETTGNLNHSPLLGVVERVFASAFHIGSTLLIASNLWLVILMIPVHTAVNLVGIRLAKKSPVGAEVFIGFVGVVVFLAGLLMFV